MKFRIILFLAVLITACGERSKIILYPAPEQEQASADFKMFVDNEPLFVYQARVSKYPINQIWPGYQRPMNQTEIASFAYFDFSGKVDIEIISDKPIETLDIRPKQFGIKPEIKDKTIRFSLSKPMQFVVEVNGYHHALHIFGNPIETFDVKKDDPKVHYFGPGIHEAGRIKVKDGETVFVDGGAIVYGSIESINTSNIKVMGRGILDASRIERNEAKKMIYLKEVTNSQIRGIILKDSQEWAVMSAQCEGIEIDNIKLIGFWRYNADGIDIVNSRNVTIKNCFVRAFDDNIVFKGLISFYNEKYNTIENIKVDNCVLWNDWGRALEIGAETVADTIKNISFTNCYIPRFTFIALDIQNGDRAWVKDILFENIYIEEPILDSARTAETPVDIARMAKTIELKITGYNIWQKDTVPGNISDITFKNIHYNSAKPTFSNFVGLDSAHTVNNIHYKGLFINDKRINDQRTFRKNEFVKNVFIE